MGKSVRKLRLAYHFVMLNACETSPGNRNKREILHFVQNDSYARVLGRPGDWVSTSLFYLVCTLAKGRFVVPDA